MKTNIIGTAKLFWHVLVEGQSGPEVTWAYNKESDRLNSMGYPNYKLRAQWPNTRSPIHVKGDFVSFLFEPGRMTHGYIE